MNYISDDFHLHYIPSYILYVQSDLQYDHLVVVNDQNEVLVYMTYDNESPTMEAAKILSMPFQQVFVSLPHQSLVWIPTEVFDPNEVNLYADYFVDNRIDRIEYKNIESFGITALYQIESTLYNRWRNLFTEATIVPSFEAILDHAYRNIDNALELLGVHIYGNQVDMFLLVNGEMRIYNTFEIQTVDDLSYFILSIFKNFAIEGKLQKILLSGASKDSEWGQRLSFYTKQLYEMKASIVWKSDNSEVVEAIKRLNLLGDLAVCE